MCLRNRDLERTRSGRVRARSHSEIDLSQSLAAHISSSATLFPLMRPGSNPTPPKLIMEILHGLEYHWGRKVFLGSEVRCTCYSRETECSWENTQQTFYRGILTRVRKITEVTCDSKNAAVSLRMLFLKTCALTAVSQCQGQYFSVPLHHSISASPIWHFPWSVSVLTLLAKYFDTRSWLLLPGAVDVFQHGAKCQNVAHVCTKTLHTLTPKRH